MDIIKKGAFKYKVPVDGNSVRASRPGLSRRSLKLFLEYKGMFKRYAFLPAVLSALLISSSCGSVKVDKEFMALLKNLATKCKLDKRYAFLKDCDADKKKVGDMVRSRGRVPTLGTVSVALNDKDENLKTVAVWALYSHYKDYMKQFTNNPKALSKGIVTNLIKGVANHKGYAAMYGARTAVHAAMITGRDKELYAMLKAHPQDSVRSESYGYLMTFGRLKAFPKIKEIASGGDKRLKRTALYAPQNMYKYTDAEKKEVCEWAKGFLTDSDEYLAIRAGGILNRICKGEYIDLVLNEVEKRDKAGTLKSPYYWLVSGFAYRFSCKGFLGSKPAGTPEQCARRDALAAKYSPKKKKK